jgi:CRP-like cAMP-binding protein
VVALVAYVVAAVTALTFVYDMRIPGLLAGSGIVAAILGLAMQDTLGNIMAGFALHLGRPFKPGDWLIVDSRHAEVIEVNWRSTRLRTTDNTYFDIPNTQLNKQVLVNLSYPDATHAMRLSIGAEYQAPPNEVKEALLHAAVQAPGVRTHPAPRAFLSAFGDSAILYDIKFWLDDPAQFNDITDSIRTNIWYEFQRRHLRLPTQFRTVQLAKAPRDDTRDALPADLLLRQAVFQCLEDEERAKLIASSQLLRFGKGERIIAQDEAGDSMFILVRGTAVVSVARAGKSTQVARLQAGDCFGEMSLLTGSPRSATVVAQTDCDTLEIQKPIVAALLQQRPELSRSLSELLARRQLETEDSLAGSARQPASDTERVRHRESIEGFLAKITRFFEL